MHNEVSINLKICDLKEFREISLDMISVLEQILEITNDVRIVNIITAFTDKIKKQHINN